ncbi:hypothetical protein [Methanocella conradii]|uniref:hypothetical protein n=1 Tax=Methanocella conradii TaxID=1175444 RepID=UPI00157C2AFC|nr:hypothetical protein [Methanocella conradii]
MLSMKVSLINTDFHSGGPENIVGTLPPLGLLYIGGALKNSGFDDVELIDLCKDVDLFKDDAELGEHVSKNSHRSRSSGAWPRRQAFLGAWP